MMYSELVYSDNSALFDKVASLTAILQRNTNSRLDGLIFRAEPSQYAFDSGTPHADNVISLVQVSSNEINIYKGDTRIFIGGGSGNPTNHALFVVY